MKKIENENCKTRQQIKNERRKINENKLQQLRQKMIAEAKRTNDAHRETGASNWLTSLPLEELDYHLNKQQFWDAIRIRYNWALSNLPAECVCGKKFDISHAMSCKKGGLVTLRHNEVRDVTGKLLEEVCKDVRKEPSMLQLNSELLQTTANRKPEARLDISVIGF